MDLLTTALILSIFANIFAAILFHFSNKRKQHYEQLSQVVLNNVAKLTQSMKELGEQVTANDMALLNMIQEIMQQQPQENPMTELEDLFGPPSGGVQLKDGDDDEDEGPQLLGDFIPPTKK